MKYTTVIFAAILFSFPIFGAKHDAKAQTEIKIPMETPPGHIKTRSAEAFKKALETISKGKYKVSIFPSAQLMMGKDEVPAVARGQVQMAVPTIGYVSNIEPAFKLLEVPMLFESYGSMEKVLNGSIGKGLLKKLEKKRVMATHFWYDGFVALWSKKPIKTVKDLKNLKIRVWPSEVLANSTKALGGSPTAIPGPEVFLALKTGVADGAWTTPPYGNLIKLYEVLNSVTKVNLFPFGYVVVVNPAWYKKQGAAGQKMIQAALAEAKAYNLREIRNAIESAYKNVAANGMKVIGFSKAERARWVKTLKPLYDGLDPEIKSMIKKIKN